MEGALAVIDDVTNGSRILVRAHCGEAMQKMIFPKRCESDNGYPHPDTFRPARSSSRSFMYLAKVFMALATETSNPSTPSRKPSFRK